MFPPIYSSLFLTSNESGKLDVTILNLIVFPFLRLICWPNFHLFDSNLVRILLTPSDSRVLPLRYNFFVFIMRVFLVLQEIPERINLVNNLSRVSYVFHYAKKLSPRNKGDNGVNFIVSVFPIDSVTELSSVWFQFGRCIIDTVWFRFHSRVVFLITDLIWIWWHFRFSK